MSKRISRLARIPAHYRDLLRSLNKYKGKSFELYIREGVFERYSKTVALSVDLLLNIFYPNYIFNRFVSDQNIIILYTNL